MAEYNIHDVFRATEGQTEFHTSQPFVVGGNDLFVYVNGMLYLSGEDKQYIEVDESTVRFNDPLFEDDLVLITSSFKTDKIDITIVGDSNKSIYKKYGADVRFKENNRYTMNVQIGKKTIQWSFTSKYSPMHSTVQNIRSDLQGLADNLTNDQINFIIYQNSKEALELYQARDDYSATNAIPTYLKMWVRYKTDIDIVYGIYLTLSSSAGRQSKLIGPMQVEKEVKIPYIKDMLARFKDMFNKYDVTLRGTTTIAAPFVKAGTNMAFPLAARGSSF